MGYVSFFENFVQIVVLLFAWIVVLLAFFILAIQLFVTLIEFKLTTLAGFVLIPFGLFGKTAFAAERVLGNVISSGVKVMVLAVIVGIGSTCSRNSPQASAAISPPSKTPCPWCWRRCLCWGSASSVPGSPTALSPVVRNSAPVLRSGRVSRPAASSLPERRALAVGAGAIAGAARGSASVAAAASSSVRSGRDCCQRSWICRTCHQFVLSRQSPSLGNAHETLANREPWGFRGDPRRSLR